MYKSEIEEIQQMKHTKWIPRKMGSLLCFKCGSCEFSFVSNKVSNLSFKYCPCCGDNMIVNSSALNERSVKSMNENEFGRFHNVIKNDRKTRDYT